MSESNGYGHTPQYHCNQCLEHGKMGFGWTVRNPDAHLASVYAKECPMFQTLCEKKKCLEARKHLFGSLVPYVEPKSDKQFSPHMLDESSLPTPVLASVATLYPPNRELASVAS